MKPIDIDKVQAQLDRFSKKQVYVHLETTNGAYASHFDDKQYNVGAFIRNAKLTYERAKIVGVTGAYRVGMKTEIGWVYAEGLSDWVLDEQDRLLLAGHDNQGRLMVALQISETPFKY